VAGLQAPKVLELGPNQTPFPARCSERPTGVEVDSATPTSVAVIPAAGPLTAVKLPS